MVDISERIQQIVDELVITGKYFVINRARQFGKTTTLMQLCNSLKAGNKVFSISLEGLGDSAYRNENFFCRYICQLLYNTIYYGEVNGLPEEIVQECNLLAQKDSDVDFLKLSNFISHLCNSVSEHVILIIDEVDQASNQEIFLSFLGMLRAKYLSRETRPTFQSVILAGIYDIKNLKLKIRGEATHLYNSPWNIATDFDIDMSFSVCDIEQMLNRYNEDYQIGMDTRQMAEAIFEYTNGYPYLVSALCKIMDEKVGKGLGFSDKSSVWTKNGLLKAIKILLNSQNTLFDDMIKHINEYTELSNMLQNILFKGQCYPYNIYNQAISMGQMFGFVKNLNGEVTISNRIFETCLYDYFLSETMLIPRDSELSNQDKNEFLKNGMLDMDRVLEKFVEHFSDLYNTGDEKFVEEQGRKLFLLFLKPIINGTGNYYVEARTRDQKRTDIIVDYKGQQFIIELKIWRGNEYNTKGEKQLADYLEAYHLKKGWMLSFCFNRQKEVGLKRIIIGDKEIVEAVV